MRLINNDGVIGFQKRITLGFGQKNAIGHEFDLSAMLRAVGKANFETHPLPQFRTGFFSQTLGD